MRLLLLFSSFLAFSYVASTPHGYYGQHNGPQRISYNQVAAYYNSAPQRARSARLFAAVKEPVAVPIRPQSSTRYHAQDEFGQYHYGYTNGDGSSKTEIRGIDGGVAGKYSYVDPEGKYIELSYVADKNGFRASGDHLPRAPKLPKLPAILERNNEDAAPAPIAPPRPAAAPQPIRVQPQIIPVRIVQAQSPQLQRNVREGEAKNEDDDWKDEVEEKEKERQEKEKERQEEEEKRREEEEKKREENEEERKKEDEERKTEEEDGQQQGGEEGGDAEKKEEGGEENKAEGGEQNEGQEGGGEEGGEEGAKEGGAAAEPEAEQEEGQEQTPPAQVGAPVPPIQAIAVPIQRPITYQAIPVPHPLPVPASAPQPQVYAQAVPAPRPFIVHQQLQQQLQHRPQQFQPLQQARPLVQPIRLIARPPQQVPVRVAVQPVKLVQVARHQPQQPIQVRLQQRPIQVNLQPAARLTLQPQHPVRIALHQQPSARLTLQPQAVHQHRPIVPAKFPFVVHQGHMKSGYQG